MSEGRRGGDSAGGRQMVGFAISDLATFRNFSVAIKSQGVAMGKTSLEHIDAASRKRAARPRRVGKFTALRGRRGRGARQPVPHERLRSMAPLRLLRRRRARPRGARAATSSMWSWLALGPWARRRW